MNPPRRPTTTTGIRTPMTEDGLIATIRRHVPLLRQSPEFVNYIHSLSLYLLEVNEGELPPEQIPEPHPGAQANITPSAHARIEKSAGKPVSDTCPMCGSHTGGKRVCPNCGHMTG